MGDLGGDEEAALRGGVERHQPEQREKQQPQQWHHEADGEEEGLEEAERRRWRARARVR